MKVDLTSNVLNVKITDLKTEWDEINPKKSRWRDQLSAAHTFFIHCIDQFVLEINQFENLSGPAKKAIVLEAAGVLFDYLIVPILPIWLQPFSGTIEEIVVTIMVSAIIDFIVSKYKKGLWDFKCDHNTAN